MKLKFLMALAFVSTALAAGPQASAQVPDSHCINILSRNWGPYKWAKMELEYPDEGKDLAEEIPDHEFEKFDALVKHVENPQDGYAAKIMMIRRAKYTIDLSTYQFARDRASAPVIKELMAALDRGVDIRVLADSFSSKRIFYPDLKALLNYRPKGPNPGKVYVKKFNPVVNIRPVLQRWFANIVNLFLPEEKRVTPEKVFLNRRSHDKILIIDVEHPELAMGILGGRNINELAHSIPEPRSGVYTDSEVIVKNDPNNRAATNVENTLGDYFNRLYFHYGNKFLSEKIFGLISSDFDGENKRIDRLHKQIVDNSPFAVKLAGLEASKFLDEGFYPVQAEFADEVQNLVRQNSVLNLFVRDPVNKKANKASIITNLKEELHAAKKSIVLVSPYIYMTKQEREFLINWLREDKTRTLTIVGNSVLTTDNVIAQVLLDHIVAPAFLKSKATADIRDQVKIYAFGQNNDVRLGGDQVYGLMHAKMAIVDGRVTLGTTYNGDFRSRRYSTEVGFFFTDKNTEDGDKLASSYQKEVDHIISRSTEWDSPEWHKLRRTGPANTLKSTLEPLAYFVFKYTMLLQYF